MTFGWPLGRWSVPGPLKSEPHGCFLGALGRHLVDFGRHFGAHWIVAQQMDKLQSRRVALLHVAAGAERLAVYLSDDPFWCLVGMYTRRITVLAYNGPRCLANSATTDG